MKEKKKPQHFISLYYKEVDNKEKKNLRRDSKI